MKKPSTDFQSKSLPAPDSIELLIFDLGGVLLDIDYALTQKAFAALGLQNVEDLYSKAAQNNLFDKVETGAISPEVFQQGLRKIIGQDIASAELDNAWNALILQLPLHRVESVTALRDRFRTCLLSNTNEIHVPCFEALIKRTIGTATYQNAFEEIFYSSRIGLRKPDPKAFQYVLDHMGVEAGKALFIDDSEQHIAAARAMGIVSYHLEVGEEDISEILVRFTDGLT